MTTTSRMISPIDFDKDGKQCDYLRLPHSVHRSAYGWLPLPLVCVKNGDGPTVLLMSGNHGDEYEGQVTLTRLVKELEPEHIQGRVIVFPMANFPAAKAGLRTSPIDDINLNRVFPGDPDGTPTLQIAHYIETVLLDMADYMLDLHSGGSSLMYLPSTILGRSDDAAVFDKKVGMTMAFGAPFAFMFPQGAMGSHSTAAAVRQNVIAIGTEVGGGGTVTPEALRICERGVRNVLRHLGVLKTGEIEPPETPTRIIGAEDHSAFTYAKEEGLFEPTAELGDEVTAGQIAGYIHHPETPWREAEEVRFEASGVLICKRIPGRVERGDCLFHSGADTTIS